jgi:hypothetical protein
MSLSLQNKAAGGADLGQPSGVARPTPSPSGAPAPTVADATRSVGLVNELRSRPVGSRPERKERGDVVQFSSVGQKKVALASGQGREEPTPQVGLEAPPASEPKGAETRVSESQMQPYKAVFQTLTAKVQFAKSESGDVIVQIVDSRTQEVVRQLPSEAFLKLQNRLEQMAGESGSGEKEKGLLLETAV